MGFGEVTHLIKKFLKKVTRHKKAPSEGGFFYRLTGGGVRGNLVSAKTQDGNSLQHYQNHLQPLAQSEAL